MQCRYDLRGEAKAPKKKKRQTNCRALNDLALLYGLNSSTLADEVKRDLPEIFGCRRMRVAGRKRVREVAGPFVVSSA